jgi:chorismate synthase
MQPDWRLRFTQEHIESGRERLRRIAPGFLARKFAVEACYENTSQVVAWGIFHPCKEFADYWQSLEQEYQDCQRLYEIYRESSRNAYLIDDAMNQGKTVGQILAEVREGSS